MFGTAWRKLFISYYIKLYCRFITMCKLLYVLFLKMHTAMQDEN